MYLVVVESPAKAKTINKYLGKDFKVVASFGHVRDLPSKNGSVVPDKDFLMKYEISVKSRKYIDEIAKAATKSQAIYLATDPDREGESISWHVAAVLKEKGVIKSDDIFKRVAFNEITKKAVLYAIDHPRSIDINLVNAQQARRALDYLVGFTLSPLLWRKLPGCRSAGRVQSVALRLVCAREEEIEQFTTTEYWDITLGMRSNKDNFTAKLTVANGSKLEKFSINNESQASAIVKAIEPLQFSVTTVEKKQQKRTPPAPFITSSLQQEAARKLGFTTKKTMQVAQKLYEGVDINNDTLGLITYMRTDGVYMSTDAIDSIRKFINTSFGDSYLPKSPRLFKSKVSNAQEAHEAIRPTDINITPESIKNKLEKDHYKLYDLIWKRAIASQMESVVINQVIVTLDSKDKLFSARATGSTLSFDGFYKIYREGVDDEKEEISQILPTLNEGDIVSTEWIKPAQHFTEPPPRYSEASLVKKLEELGIGRPSTYSSILSVLQDRKYVSLIKKRFFLEELGRLVTTFLIGFFKTYVEYDFTAKLENDLDEIAEGKIHWTKLLQNFWEGFNNNISTVSEQKTSDVIKYLEQALEHHIFAVNNNSNQCSACKNGKLTLKLGKFGAFLGCSNYPECTYKKPLTSTQDSDTQQEDNNKILGVDKKGTNIYLKNGPYGWYLQEGEQDNAKKDKPKRVALATGFTPDNITIDIAIKLFELPSTLGCYPETDEKIILGTGRYGLYLKYKNQYVSIPKKPDSLFISLDEAIKIISKSKKIH